MRHAASERAKALAEQYETIARSMESTDPDFYRADVLGLVEAARMLRDLDAGIRPEGGPARLPDSAGDVHE